MQDDQEHDTKIKPSKHVFNGQPFELEFYTQMLTRFVQSQSEPQTCAAAPIAKPATPK